MGRLAEKVLDLSWQERFLLGEALLRLGIACAALRFLPFKRVAARLGEQMVESADIETPENQVIAMRIGWAVRTASRYAPLRITCLSEAVATKWMLRRRRLSSTLYFGVAKGENGEIRAHAWLRSGSEVLTGEFAARDFAVLSSFGDGTSRSLL